MPPHRTRQHFHGAGDDGPGASSHAALAATSCGPRYDVLIRHGTVYDGSGGPGVAADVAISGDTITAIGDLTGARAALEVDATGLAVAPGFINMLSWATESLLEDGRSQSDVRQGVTLEVFGEGWAPGPLNDVRAVSVEHKLGIHASPTAVLAFGDEGGSEGFLVGAPNEGLRTESSAK